MAPGCHDFDAVLGAVTRRIVFEYDVKEPLRAFDVPMTPAFGDAFDIEESRTDVIASVASAFFARLERATLCQAAIVAPHCGIPGMASRQCCGGVMNKVALRWQQDSAWGSLTVNDSSAV